jgi:phosphoglycerol geranylgeranyltransferase
MKCGRKEFMFYEYLLKTAKAKGSAFAVLVDPDKVKPAEASRLGNVCQKEGVDIIFLGTSLLLSDQIDIVAKSIKKYFKRPIVIFPGSAYQVTKEADALLYLSLISGRNANLLIEEQVKAAPMVKRSGLEVVPTGYMLIESGRLTSATYMSHSIPIPHDKPDIAMAHALAARYLGMKLIYMDAGSGAISPVSEKMISGVAQYAELPVVVGGGIKDPETAGMKARAGASVVVVGNVFEGNAENKIINAFAKMIHYKEKTRKT